MYRHCSAASSAVHVVIKRNTAVRALLLQLLVLHLHIACSQQAPSNASTVVDDGWKLGRATYYGAPESFSATFDPIRGKGSFGVLAYGSCGFTDTSGNVPFPKDQVAAAADGNPDYPGSCGRCYAVRCKEGLVLNNDGIPISTNGSDGIYLPSVSRTLLDTSGRAWPGNPDEAQGLWYTRCYDPSKQVVVKIIDTCPCNQVLQDGAPGVMPGGEIRKQDVCCAGTAGISHFDLSYWAFEELAHPLYGKQMLQYRPVDCDSGEPLPFNPGHISKTDIYQGDTKAGWNWFPYDASYSRYAVPGLAPDGAAATCVQLAEKGGLSFEVKQGFLEGYRPFQGVTAVQVWLKSDAQTADPTVSSTPLGQPVDLKVFIQNYEFQKYCNAELRTGNYTERSVALPGGWYQVTMPFSDFRCDYGGAFDTDVDRIDFQNTNIRPALFCLAGLKLLR